ncbi:MAG: dihydroneopterin aldolase [Chloroflexota bacterium]|nr:dihydroneopterin aldolase [Chloroflexota bacterium]
MNAEDRISLIGMRFLGRHGVLLEERMEPQPFDVDLILHADLAVASASDTLTDTADYAGLFERVRQIVEGQSFRLIEALAGAIATAVLAATDPALVDAVEVRVRKPEAPLPGIFGHVEAALMRRRLDNSDAS